jgi:hypothetical protein
MCDKNQCFVFAGGFFRPRRDAQPGGDRQRHQGSVLAGLAVAQTRKQQYLAIILTTNQNF